MSRPLLSRHSVLVGPSGHMCRWNPLWFLSNDRRTDQRGHTDGLPVSALVLLVSAVFWPVLVPPCRSGLCVLTERVDSSASSWTKTPAEASVSVRTVRSGVSQEDEVIGLIYSCRVSAGVQVKSRTGLNLGLLVRTSARGRMKPLDLQQCR